MISAILKILQILGGGKAIAERGMDIWAKSKDVDLQKFKTQTEAKQAAFVAATKLDEIRTQTYGQVVSQAMNHRVFWVAWALFVIPGGVHHAAVYAVSIAGISPSTFAVLEVPSSFQEVTKQAVAFILGSQVITGSVAAVTKTLSDIFGKQRA